MKKLAQHLLACCLVTIGIMPSDAFASYALTLANSFGGSLAPSATFYFNGNTQYPFNLTNNATSLIVPASGTITAVYGNIFTAVAASGEASTINIIQNGTTTAQITNSFVIGSAGYNPFSNNSLSVSVNAGDVLQIQIVTPAWVSPPMSSSFSVSLFLQEAQG